MVGELGFQQLIHSLSFHKLQLFLLIEELKRMEFLCLQHLLVEFPNLQDLEPIIAIIFLLLLDIQCLRLQQIAHEVASMLKHQMLIEVGVLGFQQLEP